MKKMTIMTPLGRGLRRRAMNVYGGRWVHGPLSRGLRNSGHTVGWSRGGCERGCAGTKYVCMITLHTSRIQVILWFAGCRLYFSLSGINYVGSYFTLHNSYIIIHTSYFILHTSYFILYTSYFQDPGHAVAVCCGVHAPLG